MTNTPGDQPEQPEQPEERQESSGYWEQQAQQQPTTPYPQQPYPQQPYPQQPYPPAGYPTQGPVQYAPDHPRATTSLVLGILGVVLCQVLGPVAWWLGKKTLDEIDASGGRYGGRGAAQAGYVLGVVGTVLLALGLVFLIIYAVFFVALVGGSMTPIG